MQFVIFSEGDLYQHISRHVNLYMKNLLWWTIIISINIFSHNQHTICEKFY